MGADRDLKKMVEKYWSGKIKSEELLAGAKELRSTHWKLQQAAGKDLVNVRY